MSTALPLYKQSLGLFQQALHEIGDESAKQMLQTEVSKYIIRAKELSTLLQQTAHSKVQQDQTQQLPHAAGLLS
jgi:hypothetical protein